MTSRRGARNPLGRRAAPPWAAARRTRSCADSFQSLILAFKAWNGSMNVLFIRSKGARSHQARTNVSRETSRVPAHWKFEHRNSHRFTERPRGKSGRAKPGDRKNDARKNERLKKMRSSALGRWSASRAFLSRCGSAAVKRPSRHGVRIRGGRCAARGASSVRPPWSALRAGHYSFSRSTTSKGVREASMMSLLPNVHTASCATASARGAPSARTACGSAATISSRVWRRVSGVRPPK